MKTIRIETDLLRQIRALPKEDRLAIGNAIQLAQQQFGQPHRHGGVGVRKLAGQYFELRVGLDWRLVFKNAPDALVFEFMGTHDEVRRFLKG